MKRPLRTLMLAASLVLLPAASGDSMAAALGSPDHGLSQVAAKRSGPRSTDFTFETPALGIRPRVRVLLPAGYNRSDRRYPVLYLLHGAIDDYRSMVDKGEVDRLLGNRPMILVMPDSGPADGYANWVTPADDGPRRWRTFHLGQMIPWIDDHFRTIANRKGRALAGISMGGGGAFRYAAHRPDMFVAATSLSGALDTNVPALMAVTGDRVYGNREQNEVLWRGDNPLDLASNLGPVRLALHTGNGLDGGPLGDGDVVEAVVHQTNLNMNAELDRLGIRHWWDDYGPGGHLWSYWIRELGDTIKWTSEVFADPPPNPARFSYRSVQPRYAVFGWRVRIKRPAIEFSRLVVRNSRRFSIFGSGRARACLPPGRPAKTRFQVRVRTADNTRKITRRSDRRGRLCLGFRIGPGNPNQQYAPAGAGKGTVVHRADLVIRRPHDRLARSFD